VGVLLPVAGFGVLFPLVLDFLVGRPGRVIPLVLLRFGVGCGVDCKYKETPWLLIAPLYGCKDIEQFSPYLRMGPTNWTPRDDARFLNAKGFKEFLHYLENNPVEAGLARRAADWTWSSAKAHCFGVDTDDLLCFD